jgi:hypothetical protein
MQTLLRLALFLFCLSTARAQMGWTLAQCRQHFGHELWMEDDGPAFGIKYHYYTREENLARDAPAFYFPGLLVTVTFDSDGTVGKIWWRKCGDFSDREINQLLKSSSGVSWSPAPDSPTSDWREVEEEKERPTQWIGKHNGKIIFDAVEEFSPFDGGHDNLTITTRQLY